MSTTLPLYWNLSSVDKEERIDASVKLVSSVLDFQAQFTAPAENTSAENSEGEEEEAELNELDELNAEDVRYAIRRLIRGLASPRESSRLGFAVALTELLSRLNTISAERIIALVMSSSQTQGSMQGHEIRDHYFSRLFGLVATIQSGLLYRGSTLPISGSSRTLSATLTDFQTVCKELLALGDKKSWLKESCWWALGLALSGLSSSSPSWKQEAFGWLAQTVYSESQLWSSEKVAFTISFQRVSPSLGWKDLLAPTFKDSEMLSTRNIPTVSRILREAPIEDLKVESSKSSSPWKPQLHYAWTTIFQAYFPPDGNPSPSHSSFQEFYRAAVEESLFSNTASPERKSWGFSVVQLALNSVPPAEIPLLFTQNFMRIWINHLSAQDRALHKTARQVAAAVQSAVNKHPAIGFTLILQLIGRHGSKQFDKITRTKTVENLIASADVEGVKGYVGFLRGQLLDEANIDSAALNTQRVWAIDQLAALIKNTAVPRDDSLIELILELFVVHGFFTVSKSSKSPIRSMRDPPKQPFSSNTKHSCRQRLFSCLADLTSQSTPVKGPDGKLSKQPGVATDGELWLAKVSTLLELLGAEKHCEAIVEATPQLAALRNKARNTTNRLRSTRDERGTLAVGCSALVQSLLLQTYDTDADVFELLKNCLNVTERLIPSGKTKKKSTSENNMDIDPNDVPPVDEIVDILIGFLEGSTSFSRTVATFTFAHLTTEIRRTTVDFILKQLEEKNLDDDEHSSHNDEEEDEWDEESEISSEDSSDDSVDDSAEEDEDKDDVDADDTGDDELREQVAAALNTNADGESEEEEQLMDDEQMLKLDDQLAAVFRMQRGPNSDKKRAENVKREATHFKNRVLDFLDIFIRNESTSSLIPTLILPLIETIKAARADEGHFTQKAAHIINGRVANLKQMPESLDSSDDIVQQLHELHELSRKAPSSAFESTLSSASIYLSRVIAHSGRPEEVAEAYQESLRDFVTRKGSRLNISFFQTWIKRQTAVAWLAGEEIVKLCQVEEAVNEFRRMQAFQLLQDLVSNAQSLVDSVPQGEFIAFFSSCQHAIESTLAKAAVTQDAEGLNATQIKQVIRCALQVVRLAKRVTPNGKIDTVWRPEAVSSLLARFEQNARFKNSSAVAGMCKQLLSAVSTVPKVEKTKATEHSVPKDLSRPVINGNAKEKKSKSAKRKSGHLEGEGTPSSQKKKKKMLIDATVPP